MMHAMFDIEQK